jgi:hypothetical protein
MIWYYSSDKNLNSNYQYSKPQRLSNLADMSQNMWNAIATSFDNDPGFGLANQWKAVKTGVSTIASDTTSYGYSMTTGNANQIGASGLVADTNLTPPPQPPPPSDWPPPSGPHPGSRFSRSRRHTSGTTAF